MLKRSDRGAKHRYQTSDVRPRPASLLCIGRRRTAADLGVSVTRINESGMTLVEVLVSVVLVALLAAGIAGIASIIGSSLRTSLQTQDEYNISNQIRAMFENEQSCRLALGGPANFGDPASNSPYSQTVAGGGLANI